MASFADKLRRVHGTGLARTPERGAVERASDAAERVDGEPPPPAPGAFGVAHGMVALEEERVARRPGAALALQSHVADLVGPLWDAPRRARVLPRTEDLPGELEATPEGPLRAVRTEHPRDHRHGAVPVSLALSAAAADLAVLALDPQLGEVDFSRALYIDTETTGLSGGAGTVPFLVGTARFEAGRLVVEQLLLERPGEEAPLLARLARRLHEASAIVSYNGKSFDWPLLRTRFILNRIAVPAVPPHLDLLHCARRVYKERVGQLRLVHLEEQVLDFTREDDVPGALIPDLYFGFVKGRLPASVLHPIVRHNGLDLAALPALLGELARCFRSVEPQDPRDQLGFAQVAARADEVEHATLLAERAARADVLGELAPRALYLAGQLALRRGELDAAVDALERALAAAGAGFEAGLVHLALAKIFEHRRRDYGRALQHAEQVGDAEERAARARRCDRLERKLSGRGSEGGS